jgi:ADP-heptose:LPS heptosyltransferase
MIEVNNQFKIGVFRALYLGDLLCIIPTVRALRKAYPSALITLIGLPWQKQFVERFQHYFDAFVEFPGWPGLPERPVDIKRIPHFLQEMQEQRFDLIMQMQGNGELTNAMCMLWGATQVAGLRKPNEFCPDENRFIVSEDHEHEVLRFLKLTDSLNIPRQGDHLEFPLFAHEREKVTRLLECNGVAMGKFICLHPGSRDPRRRWPAEHFAFLADKLAADGHNILLTGSDEEKELLQQVTSLMELEAINTVEVFGHLQLGELASLIHFSMGLISNDTGVSHIAAALEVPSVIIFSRYSAASRWAPLDRSSHAVILPEHAQDLDTVYNVVLRQINLPSRHRLAMRSFQR